MQIAGRCAPTFSQVRDYNKLETKLFVIFVIASSLLWDSRKRKEYRVINNVLRSYTWILTRYIFSKFVIQVYLKAVKNNRGDLRTALAESSKQVVPATGPRVIQHTTRSNKVIDTENKLQKSQVQADGRIVTETKKTVEHEEVINYSDANLWNVLPTWQITKKYNKKCL